MQLIPAIDLRGGQVVRLRQGDFKRETRYQRDPVALAEYYADSGAEVLHIVDLDAARDGGEQNMEVMQRMVDASGLCVQVGGGVRARADVRRRLDVGCARVVVGSVAATAPERFVAWLQEFGADNLVAALDVRRGEDGAYYPAVHGWVETGKKPLERVLNPLISGGLRHLLATDIARDGELSGPNLDLYHRLLEYGPGLAVQASGGVSELEDFDALLRLDLAGVIVGKALLENRFTVKDALQRLAQQPRQPDATPGPAR